jgi:hypothetical protein
MNVYPTCSQPAAAWVFTRSGGVWSRAGGRHFRVGSKTDASNDATTTRC